MNNLTSLKEAALYLNVSEELILKFIHRGIITPVFEKSQVKLTAYNFRRLIQAVDLHEQCFPPETIDFLLNN